MVTKEDIKMMLEVQQKAYKDVTQLLLASITSKVEQLEKCNLELQRSLEYTQKEVDSLKEENIILKKDLVNMNTELIKKTNTEEKINKINDRLDYQEDYSRRCNLRFDGIDEKPNESWEVTQEKVQRLLNEKMNLGQVELERVHRVGPRSASRGARPRTVVARFARFADRQLVIKNSSRLKNTHIYINEDLCEASVQLRKAKLSELRKAKAEGKIAYFSHTKLIVRDRRERSGETADSSEQGPSTATVVSASGARGPSQHLLTAEQPGEPGEEQLRNATESRVTRQKTKGPK